MVAYHRRPIPMAANDMNVNAMDANFSVEAKICTYINWSACHVCKQYKLKTLAAEHPHST